MLLLLPIIAADVAAAAAAVLGCCCGGVATCAAAAVVSVLLQPALLLLLLTVSVLPKLAILLPSNVTPCCPGPNLVNLPKVSSKYAEAGQMKKGTGLKAITLLTVSIVLMYCCQSQPALPSTPCFD